MCGADSFFDEAARLLCLRSCCFLYQLYVSAACKAYINDSLLKVVHGMFSYNHVKSKGIPDAFSPDRQEFLSLQFPTRCCTLCILLSLMVSVMWQHRSRNCFRRIMCLWVAAFVSALNKRRLLSRHLGILFDFFQTAAADIR